MTLPGLHDTHRVENKPDVNVYRCWKTGCDFRIFVRVFGADEARRLAVGHHFDPSATVEELVGFRTRRAVESSGDPAPPTLGSSRTVDPLRPAAPTTYVNHVTTEDA